MISWFLRNKLQMSFPHIASIFGRDHTTIIHYIRSIYNKKIDLSRVQDLVDAEIKLVEYPAPGTGQSTVAKWQFVYDYFDGKCVVCGYDDIVEVHHLRPKRLGGTDLISNLLLFCPNHHAAYHAGLVDIKKVKLGNPQDVQP